jgi:hypothetical protein
MNEIAYLTNFSNLDATLNIQKNLLNEFSKNFSKIYFINSQNLRYFPKIAKKNLKKMKLHLKLNQQKIHIF